MCLLFTSDSQYANWALDTTALLERACLELKKTPKPLVKFENKEIVPGRACGPLFAAKMWNKSTAQQLVRVGKATKAFLDKVLSTGALRKNSISDSAKSFTLPGAAKYSARHYLHDLCVFAGVAPSLDVGHLGYEAKTMSQGGYGVLEKYGEHRTLRRDYVTSYGPWVIVPSGPNREPHALKNAMVEVDARCADINFWAMTVNDCRDQ